MHIHGINVTLDFTGTKESSDHFGIEGVGRCFRAGNRVEITHLIHGFDEVVCFLHVAAIGSTVSRAAAVRKA